MPIRPKYICLVTMCCLCPGLTVAQAPSHLFGDTSRQASSNNPEYNATSQRGGWGLDILISTDGFGLGGYYRRELSPDIAGTVSLSISESKDPREEDQIDPFTGVTYTPGKLNRFLVLPLMFGIQYRLFREDITDSFRPYINCGAGPSMIYVMPYAQVTLDSTGFPQANQIDFFSAIGKGHSRWTGGGFVGFGASFGPVTGNTFGFNIRYYFMYLFSGSIPSLYNIYNGSIASTKRDFGGFFITLNVGIGG